MEKILWKTNKQTRGRPWASEVSSLPGEPAGNRAWVPMRLKRKTLVKLVLRDPYCHRILTCFLLWKGKTAIIGWHISTSFYFLFSKMIDVALHPVVVDVPWPATWTLMTSPVSQPRKQKKKQPLSDRMKQHETMSCLGVYHWLHIKMDRVIVTSWLA